MILEVKIIFFLCLLIVFLLGKQQWRMRQQKHQQQNEKMLQALSAYPVYQYTIGHMLERCLAIIFAAPQLSLLPKGAIYLHQKDKLNLIAHRGLPVCNRKHQKVVFMTDYLIGKITKVNGVLQGSNNRLRECIPYSGFFEPGQFVIPLMLHKKLLGVLTIDDICSGRLSGNKERD